MGKRGEQRERKEDKRAIKGKKKFKTRNSIGNAKKKNGSAGQYITRTQAINLLQVTLKDFRRLCILKGIYPREPKKKFKGSNTTYFFAKDILFLSHEPLLAKFREQKAFLKKIRRACGRHENKIAKRLDDRRPVCKLDHLIRERYPTFGDALQDLDDALSLTFLFASLASSKFVPAVHIQSAMRLRREFHAYIVRTCSLRKVFLSIKGIYYQAEVQGCCVTWVEPHAFAQHPTMAVDYRVMLSFLELYESVLTFVNFKLYHDLGVAYPPKTDANLDATGAFLSAMLCKKAYISLPPDASIAAVAPAIKASGRAPKLSQAQVKSLHRKLEDVDAKDTASSVALSATRGPADAASHANAFAGEMAAVIEGEIEKSILTIPSELAQIYGLFSSCVVFCGRETPVGALEFVVLATGGRVGWEGEASPLRSDDASITHQVVDRPQISGMCVTSREYVQPQWVFDCVNARQLLPPQLYQPGTKCPPHLSPFCDGTEGYVPSERTRQPMDTVGCEGETLALPHDAGEQGEERVGEEVEAAGHKGEDDEEFTGAMTSELMPKANLVGKDDKVLSKVVVAEEDIVVGQVAEEKQLTIMMMPRTKKQLYDKMQHGIKKKEVAACALRKKRQKIDSQATCPNDNQHANLHGTA